ncbi:MAG: helix-turn-helix domain-containing protein [Hoeflea sp.]
MAQKARNADPNDLMAEIRKRIGSMSELARRHGVSTSTIRCATRRPQPTGNRIIAEFLGRSVHELWPEWFDADGNRRLSSPNRSAARSRSQCQKREAA